MPVRINSKWRLDSFPTSSVSNSRSRVMIWEALATESLGRPVARAGRSTFPGASAHVRLLVKGTQTTLLIRLRFSASPWTTRTGLRKPGPEPVGSGRFAQYTWPWATTIRRFQGCALPLLKWLDPGTCLPPRRPDSSPRLWLQDRAVRCTLLQPPCKPGFVTSLAGGTTARLQRKPYQELKSQFSYQKYNHAPLRLQAALDLARKNMRRERDGNKEYIRFAQSIVLVALSFQRSGGEQKSLSSSISELPSTSA
jgi:hypothetical protein